MSREVLLPPLGDEIATHVESFCKRRGMDPRKAQEQGEQLAELMLTLYAGQKIAFPADPFRHRDIERRNEAIRRAYPDKSADELAKEHHLSRRWIFHIVNRKL